MNGPLAAALLLSLALVVFPSSPRRRLGCCGVPTVGESRSVGGRGAGCVAACAARCRRRLAAVDDRARRPRWSARPRACVTVAAVASGAAPTRAERWKPRLDVLVGELRVGSHPVHAFDVAADETDGAVAASLRAVAARARLGADVAAGLRAAAGSSALPTHWDRLAVCWQLASRPRVGHRHPDACGATRYRRAATVLGTGDVGDGRGARHRGHSGGPAGARACCSVS